MENEREDVSLWNNNKNKASFFIFKVTFRHLSTNEILFEITNEV